MGATLTTGALLGTNYNSSGVLPPFLGLCVSLILYLLLYFYADNVVADEFGMKKDYLFFLKGKKKRVSKKGYSKIGN